ncbi:DUF4390 domain-containing protein [soil metagenome]
MATRPAHFFSRMIFTCLLALLAFMLMPHGAARATEVDVTSARLESSEEGYRMVAAFSFELSHGLEDAITRGIPMYFTTEVELTRPRWYWFDEKTIRSAQTVRIAYNLWTRKYTAAINGSLQQNFSTLEDALALVLRPRRWLVADKGSLSAGEIYNVAIRLKLDINQLPKPFLITALNNSDWRLSSDWKRFTFKADEK